MDLLAATGEGVSVEKILLTFIVTAPLYAAIAWFTIKKKLNVSARYDGQTMIVKWVVSYIVFAFILIAAAYAGGGFALIGLMFVVVLPGSILLATFMAPYISN